MHPKPPLTHSRPSGSTGSAVVRCAPGLIWGLACGVQGVGVRFDCIGFGAEVRDMT